MTDVQARRDPASNATAAFPAAPDAHGRHGPGGGAGLFFFCSTCGSRLEATTADRGQVRLCPYCLRETTVPEQPLGSDQAGRGASLFERERILSLWMRFLCPSCGAKLAADARAGGAQAECPHCGTGVRVPLLPGLVSPPPEPDGSGVTAAVPGRAGGVAVLSAEEVRFLTADRHG